MNDPSLVESILYTALGKDPGADRSLYLDEACRGQPELRSEVDRLLAAHPQAIGFLEAPTEKGTAAFASTKEHPGNVVAGRYKLLERIGEGAWAKFGSRINSNRFAAALL